MSETEIAQDEHGNPVLTVWSDEGEFISSTVVSDDTVRLYLESNGLSTDPPRSVE